MRGVNQRYEEAFRDASLTTLPGSERSTAAHLASSVRRAEILAGLDDWTVCAADEKRRNSLLTIARLADPDTWRDQVRNSSTWHDTPTLAELARTAGLPTSRFLY